MEPPMTDVELVPEKETIEDGKEGGPAFHCDLYDAELVRKIAQLFVPGLSAACVDNTTGGIFKSPASVAVDMRKEMIEYLTQRSETFVAETIILEGGQNAEVSEHPYDIIADFVDDFASSKRNFFSRVQGWVLSEKREDKIDDFVQEMEVNGFWLSDRREVIAQTLVKNVDFKNTFHCDKKFNTAEELEEHAVNCDFRTINCTNGGCTAFFCASDLEKHDSVCPFKIIPCEQKCSDHIMRREMDRHCITVCPMKLVNCPFYAVGCQFTVPRCMIQKHCSDELNLHLVYALKNIHKGASEEDLKERVDQIVQSSSGQLQAARDARSLTLRVRDLDAKLGPLVITEMVSEESTEAANDDVTEKSIKASNDVTEKSTEDSNDVTDKSIKAANDVNVTNKSIEATNDVTEKSTEVSNDVTDKSIEAANEVSDKSIEVPNNATDESIEAANDVSEKSIEVPNNATDKSIEAANDVSEKSIEVPNNATDKSIEAANDVSEKSIKVPNDATDKSTEAADDVADKSTETADDVTDKSMEVADDTADKSNEDVNKAVEESSQAGDEVIEKSTNSPNKVGEESTETFKLTAHASEERIAQLST